jgi:hypothetical protein
MGLAELLNENSKTNKELKLSRPSPFYISMSIIKYIIDQNHEFKNYCPLLLKEMLKGEIPNNKPTFQKGKLLETLVLGSSAKGDSVNTLGVNKKNGGMLKDETDIRLFAQLCKIKILKHQISVIENYNTQVPIICKLDKYDDVYLRTELDLFPTIFCPYPDKDNCKLELTAIDLKSTPNIDNGFGAYNWNNFSEMDHIQPDSIFYILNHINLDLLKLENPKYEAQVGYDNIFTSFVLNSINKLHFYYMVVGYKMDLDLRNIRFFERKMIGEERTPSFRQKEFEQRMMRAIERIEWHYEHGFEAIPYYNKYEATGCKFCQVNKDNNSEEFNNNKGYCVCGNIIPSS